MSVVGFSSLHTPENKPDNEKRIMNEDVSPIKKGWFRIAMFGF